MLTKTEFEKALTAKQEKTERYLQTALPEDGLLQKTVTEAMAYSLLSGGKRIRPVLVLATCEALSGNEDAALPFAAALEMIHTYSLIHDDLPAMDNDDLRRGKPTNHKVYGEATAILAGDALLNYAFETALAAPFDERGKIAILTVLARAAGVYGMIGGQTVDLEGEKRALTFDELRHMHAMKTGALISAAVAIGALAAGKSEDTFASYAENLGLAFQLKDDILDATSTTEALGKPVGSDEKNEKSTFIRLCGMDETKRMLEDATKSAIDGLNGESEFLEMFARYLLERKN